METSKIEPTDTRKGDEAQEIRDSSTRGDISIHSIVPDFVAATPEEPAQIKKSVRSIAEDDKVWFSVVLLTFWALLLGLYGGFAKYGDDVLFSASRVDGTYLFYHNIAIMIFVGFGFLMTFLHRYAYAAVGGTFLVSMLCIYWGMLCTAFFHQCYEFDCSHARVTIDLVRLIYGLFAAGAVMISFGGVLGKVTPLQLLAMAIVEVPLFCINEHICANLIKVRDVGGAMTIHLFGAYFGLAVCLMRRHKGGPASPDNKASPDHDIFAMIGTLFLWICWPSFNAALAGDLEHLTILNTVMSIGASCVTAFLVSAVVHRGKFDMVTVQNATLAGGVAMGASGDLIEGPVWAMVVGSIAGTVSTLGFSHIQPFLFKTVKLHDTCGIHNLHGMPGVIGGIVSIVALSDHTAMVHQVEALFCSFGIAVGGGLLTGLFLNLCNNMDDDEAYKDDAFWLVEEE
mmetsp:Transcript_26811/g.63709  ORF Transcript_26811/g.63709 Transcript_26811/m.63709 type:complete len:455 (-) Transcript_26811:337-1701(-)